MLWQHPVLEQAAHPSRQPLLDVGRRSIEQLGDLPDRKLSPEAKRERVALAAVEAPDGNRKLVAQTGGGAVFALSATGGRRDPARPPGSRVVSDHGPCRGEQRQVGLLLDLATHVRLPPHTLEA